MKCNKCCSDDLLIDIDDNENIFVKCISCGAIINLNNISSKELIKLIDNSQYSQKLKAMIFKIEDCFLVDLIRRHVLCESVDLIRGDNKYERN